MKVHVALILACVGGGVSAQDFKSEAQRHIRMTMTSVDICQADLQVIELGLQMHRLNPSDRSALSPQAAARRLAQCGQDEGRNVQKSLPASRDEGPCRVALEDFHGSALAHLESIAADPLESVPQIIRRTRTEAMALRQRATKTRLACQ